MTLLQESIGPEGFKRVDVDYFPSLPILDIEEILERIGPEWKNPGPSNHHTTESIDRIIGDWVSFCDAALKGHQITRDTIEKGVIKIDLESIDSYLIFTQALREKGKYPQIIRKIRGAFWDLLSPKAREDFGERGENTKVDNKLRAKIGQLIGGIDIQAGFAASKFLKQLSEIDD